MAAPGRIVVPISRLARTDELRLKNVTIKTFLPDPGVHHTTRTQLTPYSPHGITFHVRRTLYLFFTEKTPRARPELYYPLSGETGDLDIGGGE